MASHKVTLTILQSLHQEVKRLIKAGYYANFAELARAGIRKEIKELYMANPALVLETDGLLYLRRLEEIRQIIIDTIQGMEDVLQDKPINALVEEIGDGSIRFRVRWWISSYLETRDIYDRVNTAVYYAIKSSGIGLASDSYDLNVNVESEPGEEIPPLDKQN